MERVERIGVSLEKKLLSMFDKLIAKQGYQSRSEALFAVCCELVRREVDDDTIYAVITDHLGFTPFRHEGKIVGLAAYGNRDNIKVDFPFRIRNGNIEYLWRWGLRVRKFLRFLEGYASEKARRTIASLMKLAPEVAIVKKGKDEVTATDIVKAGRLATTVRKRFIIAVPDLEPENTRYLIFKWFKA